MLILLDRRVSHLNKTNKSTEVIHTRNSDSTEIKLPTLSLPTFSGIIDEWLTFSDLFQAAVTNKQNLTGAQKLQYLKGVLKGDAQKIVQSLPITDGSLLVKALIGVENVGNRITHCYILTPSEPNSSIPRDANNSVLSTSAQMFHPVMFDATNTDTGPNPPNVNNPSITSCLMFDSNSQVLLCTAQVNVCYSFGGTQLCRVLLDPGSQACLITNSCLEILGLPRKRAHVCISCLGASDTRTNGISEIKFTPHFFFFYI
ncbi:DUF1758 domain-containing protein [Trichonephila inaurata madagascariensis]|uniref:DUF1758 domain-containing protein n=1 Tax=Trichonephila inaurata madagascariensis TaxID=2747483 RepID=A0A8X6XJC3_9ARAC|nr:DUF1758 domain-containing protein [Trichonephila inaurata madagascariensis]